MTPQAAPAPRLCRSRPNDPSLLNRRHCLLRNNGRPLPPRIPAFPRLARLALLMGLFLPAAPALRSVEPPILAPLHVVPMEVIRGKPYVMVTLNGKGPFRFLVDTGTGGDAIVTSELVKQLNLPQAGEARLNDPTGFGARPAPLRLIDSLEFAGLAFHGVRAVEHSLPEVDGACMGLLGFPLFKDFLLTLDYPDGRLILARGALQPDNERSVHAFRMPDGVPLIRLIIGKAEVDAQLDSGGAGLALPERLAAQLRFSSRPVVFANGESLSTRFQLKVGKLATDVRIGEITLDTPWVEINPAFPLANFGSCPMQHFAFTFDQHNLLVRITGPRKRINLGVTPAPLRLANQPAAQPGNPSLVPVG